MLAGEIYGSRKVRLIDVEEPQLDENSRDELIFQPELACLCGSDLPYFEADYPEHVPHIGQSLHEMIGHVVASSGTRFQAGDRVLVVPEEHYGFFGRYRVSDRRAIPFVGEPSDAEALLAQPLGTVIFALRKIPHLLGLDVVVMGQGPMGQLHCAALRNVGARRIIAVDIVDSRLEVSPKMGATHTINAAREDLVEEVKKITGGRMADLVIEAVGHRDQVLNQCVELCRPRGQILFFGVPCATMDNIEWSKLFWKNLTIHNSVGPSFEEDFPLALQWINEGRINVAPIITHRMPVSEIQHAFDLFANRDEGALKVFLDFPKDGE